MLTRTEKNKQIQDEIIKEESVKKFKKISKIIFTLITSITLIILYGMYIGAKVVIVNEYKITNKSIPSSFHGMKIVQISDLLYNSLNQNDLKKIKDQINEIEPDILVFTGNLKKETKLTKEDLEFLKNFFNQLNANIDKYAIPGNLDDDSLNTVLENNFKILNNNKFLLYYKDAIPIEIIGFNTNNLNFENISESNNYQICLFSDPDKIDEILKYTKCNLALAGNTLGGEIKLFGNSILDNHKYNKDYYKIKDTNFYISNGLGNQSNVRYFNHPSISLYRLTKY